MTWCNFPMNGNYHEPSVDWFLSKIKNIEHDYNKIIQMLKNITHSDGIYINVLNPPNELEPLKNDGITDNSSALNNILNWMKTNNVSGRIFFPRGRYLFMSPISINSNHIMLSGEEKGGSELFTTSTSNNLININDCRFIGIENLALWVRNGTSENRNTAISCGNTQQVYVFNSIIYDFHKSVYLYNSSAFKTLWVSISTSDINYDDNIGIDYHGLNNGLIIDNSVISGQNYGMYFNDDVQDIKVTNLQITDTKTGIVIENETGPNVNNVFHNITIDEFSKYGILIRNTNSDSSFTFSNIMLFPLTNNIMSIRIENSHNVLFYNCSIINNHSLTEHTGISQNIGTGNVFNGIYLLNCSTGFNLFGANSKCTQIVNCVLKNDNTALNNGIMVQQTYSALISNNVIQGNIKTPINIFSTSHYCGIFSNLVNSDETVSIAEGSSDSVYANNVIYPQ